MKESKRHRDMADLEERKVKDVFRVSKLDHWDSGSNKNEKGSQETYVLREERPIEF